MASSIIVSAVASLIGKAVDSFMTWTSNKTEMTISKMEYDLMKQQLTQHLQLKLMEEARKPQSELRQFIVDYEGAAKDLSPFWRGVRSSVRPVITYWSLIIITLILFGVQDGQAMSNNLQHIPPELWTVFQLIFGFWFGGRAIQQIAATYQNGQMNVSREQESYRLEAVREEVKKAQYHMQSETIKAKSRIEAVKQVSTRSVTTTKEEDHNKFLSNFMDGIFPD